MFRLTSVLCQPILFIPKRDKEGVFVVFTHEDRLVMSGWRLRLTKWNVNYDLGLCKARKWLDRPQQDSKPVCVYASKKTKIGSLSPSTRHPGYVFCYFFVCIEFISMLICVCGIRTVVNQVSKTNSTDSAVRYKIIDICANNIVCLMMTGVRNA